jgi:hypothetical protein
MWFTLVLRYLGASEIFNGLHNFVTAYNVHTGNFSGGATAMAFVNHGVASITAGLAVLLGAPHISAFLVSALPSKQIEPSDSDPSNV